MPTYLSPGVYMEEVSSGSKPIEGVGTAVAAFVGFAERGPLDEPTLVTNWRQFTSVFGEFIPGSYLAHAVYGYFLNGGGVAYVVRVAELPAAGDGARPALTVSVLPAAAASGGDVTIEVSDASEPSDDTFKLVVKRGGRVVETFDNLTARKGPNNVVTAVRAQSQTITIEEVKGRGALAPAKGEVALAAPPPPAPVAVRPTDYIGSTADRTGFAGLEAIDDVTMLCVPDVLAAHQQGLLDEDGVKAVHLAMIAHCELMGDRVAIIDPPPALNAQKVKTWRVDEAGYDSKYATLYWPWIKVMDPASGRPIMLPPSGHVAGVWARSDSTRGVHKAPANEVVRGVLAPELAITKGEHDQLNPVAVNCIRAFPGQGVRIWGARTLSSDPEWRYLNVRRLFNYVEKSILNGTNWVVFEPNDPKLWDSVKRTATMFLRRVWRDGALFGATPAQAFYVKCDEENNPAENRDAGILTVEIGIAPVKPAEFVVFRISQFNEGAGVEE
ncbi:MAG: phage tail protein [Catenulispora sp. 13_1_20CM_3_70_7]|nr:MAG: phage tail protein [Catenulispora sp. 13_1_20CM_3_70_7]